MSDEGTTGRTGRRERGKRGEASSDLGNGDSAALRPTHFVDRRTVESRTVERGLTSERDPSERDLHDIGTPPIATQYRHVIETGVADFKDMMASGEAMWKANGQNKGIQKYNLATGIGAKGFGVIEFPPQAILDVLLRPFTDPLTAALDPDMKFGRDVARPDGHTSISYLCYKGVWPVAERDMVIMAHWRVEADRSIMFFAKSISDAAAAGLGIGPGEGYITAASVGKPIPVKGRVRADLLIGGWHLKPINGGVGGGGASWTEATYLASLDLKVNGLYDISYWL